MDAPSRRILGFTLAEHHDAAMAYGALAVALATGGGTAPGVIMHTDGDSEYAARAFRAACQRSGIAQSMGRPGSALDNVVIEAWHSTLESGLRRWNTSPAGRCQSQSGRLDRGLQHRAADTSPAR